MKFVYKEAPGVSRLGAVPSSPSPSAIILLLLILGFSTRASRAATVVTVVGASGTADFGQQFSKWEQRWRSVCESATVNYVSIGTGPQTSSTDREQLKSVIEAHTGESSDSLWIVFIGHGTSFGDVSNFNLRGPDVSANDLATWLGEVRRPVIVINCSSCSGPFLARLSHADRIAITATQSGAEQNYCRFGDYLSIAMTDRSADLDHDQQVSLLEAFLTASRNTQRFYDGESRLASEHSMIDDNGDELGTPASFFSGIHAAKSPATDAKVDGLRAHQCFLVRGGNDSRLSTEELVKRDQLELEIERFRKTKAKLGEGEYFDRLETIMIKLSHLYSESD